MPVADARSPLAHGASRSAWVKAHAAVQADDALWRLLRLDGLQPDGLGSLFEARSCPCCQSTILRPISHEQALALCAQLATLQAQAMEALSLSCPGSALSPSVLTSPPFPASQTLGLTSP